MDATIPSSTSPRKSERPFTYRDYRSWPEDERWELIDGVAYAMSPAPRLLHQSLLGGLFAQIYSFFDGKPCRPIAPIDVFLPAGDEALGDIEHVVQPDAFLVCDKSKLIDEGVLGAPDFIIEVLSPNTAIPTRNNPSILAKCASRLNKRHPCSIQLAAIQTSFVGIGVPFFLSMRFISANHSAVVSVMGTQTVRGFSRNLARIALFSSVREPSKNPSSSSPTTTGDSSIASLLASSSATRPSPTISAEYALVSISTRLMAANPPRRCSNFPPAIH